MNNERQDQAMALAAIFLAIDLVRDIANDRPVDKQGMATMLYSLMDLDPATPQAIYGGGCSLARGLELLVRQLENAGNRDVELMRYAVLVLHLERKLSRHPELLGIIRSGIERANQQVKFFDIHHESVVAALAELYKQTLSTLQPRIMVQGNQDSLELPENRDRIRALLLAAIRAAVLWRQRGGNRLSLVFGRKAVLAQAKEMLFQAENGGS